MKTNKIVYLISVVIILVFIYKSCDNSSEKPAKKVIKNEWYVGGTLHKSKIADWKKATDKNKLATCADFMAQRDNTISSTIELKKRAQALKVCVDEATKGVDSADKMKVSEVAANCIILLGF